MADCLNNEEQINSNLSESNVDALTSNLDSVSSVTSEMGVESSISSTMSLTDATTSNLGSEEPLNSELDLPTTYTYKGSETDNIVVTVDNKGFIISASVKQIKFNSFSDFPKTGSEHLIYIDATNKTLYGWDSNVGEYYKLVADVKVPTKLSEFENDGDGVNPFITKLATDLVNYYLKSETYTKEEINQRVSAIPKFSITVVESLPTQNISETTVYLLKTESTDNENLYQEYIYVNGVWELLGSQKVDLTNYYTKSEVDSFVLTINSRFNDYYTTATIDVLISSLNDELIKITQNERQIAGINGSFKAGGATSAGTNGVSIGQNSETGNYSVSLGNYAMSQNFGVAIGSTAQSYGGSAIGTGASTLLGGAVGKNAVSGDGFAGGNEARTLDDSGAFVDAIQLGKGTNKTNKTLQVYDDNIYNANTHTLTVKNIELDGEDIKDKIGGGDSTIIWEVWE